MLLLLLYLLFSVHSRLFFHIMDAWSAVGRVMKLLHLTQVCLISSFDSAFRLLLVHAVYSLFSFLQWTVWCFLRSTLASMMSKFITIFRLMSHSVAVIDFFNSLSEMPEGWPAYKKSGLFALSCVHSALWFFCLFVFLQSRPCVRVAAISCQQGCDIITFSIPTFDVGMFHFGAAT